MLTLKDADSFVPKQHHSRNEHDLDAFNNAFLMIMHETKDATLDDAYAKLVELLKNDSLKKFNEDVPFQYDYSLLIVNLLNTNKKDGEIPERQMALVYELMLDKLYNEVLLSYSLSRKGFEPFNKLIEAHSFEREHGFIDPLDIDDVYRQALSAEDFERLMSGCQSSV